MRVFVIPNEVDHKIVVKLNTSNKLGHIGNPCYINSLFYQFLSLQKFYYQV